MKHPVSAAVYIRVSTEEQTEFSPDAQLRAIRRYAEQNGLTLYDAYIFKDEGISGRNAKKRPAFQQMVALAKTKPRPFDVILVHKFDRFARSREDSIVYKSLLRKECGIRVVSITERIEDDKFAVILEAMLEAMAEYYSMNLGEEVKKGMTEKALRGQLQTPAPFGYRMIDGMLTPHDAEADMVEQIFIRFAYEQVSPRGIARYVNAMGFRTKKGGAFTARSILYILRNPTYTGKMRWNPNPDKKEALIVEGRHPGIIKTEMWKAADERLRQREIMLTPRRFASGEIITHWLRGVVRCAACGSSLSYGKGYGNRKSAYRCGKYLTGGCTEAQRITTEKIEQITLAELSKDEKKACPGVYALIQETSLRRADDIKAYADGIAQLQKQLDRAADFALKGIDTAEEYQRNKERIKEHIRSLQELIDATEEPLPADNIQLTQPMQKSQATCTKVSANYSSTVSGVTEILMSDTGNTKKNIALNAVCRKMVYDKKGNHLDLYYYLLL